MLRRVYILILEADRARGHTKTIRCTKWKNRYLCIRAMTALSCLLPGHLGLWGDRSWSQRGWHVTENWWGVVITIATVGSMTEAEGCESERVPCLWEDSTPFPPGEPLSLDPGTPRVKQGCGCWSWPHHSSSWLMVGALLRPFRPQGPRL